jgi:hypothetical protein
MSALGQKQTFALPPEAAIVSGNPCIASLIFGCAGSPQTSKKIIQKGLASSRRQSGTVSSSWRWPALRDPAPPVALLRWGFGGDGDGRRTPEGDPDDQGNGET